jgi:hypothetical protein
VTSAEKAYDEVLPGTKASEIINTGSSRLEQKITFDADFLASESPLFQTGRLLRRFNFL